MSIPTPSVLPLDARYDADKADIRARLIAGETLSYADVEDIDDMRWDELRRELPIIEVAGVGYRQECAVQS